MMLSFKTGLKLVAKNTLFITSLKSRLTSRKELTLLVNLPELASYSRKVSGQRLVNARCTYPYWSQGISSFSGKSWMIFYTDSGAGWTKYMTSDMG